MQRLLIITENFPNEKNTFLGTYVVAQLRELKKYYHITILAPTAPHSPISKKYDTFEEMDIIRFHHFPLWIRLLEKIRIFDAQRSFFENKRWIHDRLLKLAKQLHDEKPFFLVHGHEIYIGDEASAVGRALGIPSVVTIHGLYQNHRDIVKGRSMDLVFHNLHLSTSLIIISEMARASYENAGLHHPHFWVLTNGLAKNGHLDLDPQWQHIMHNRIIILTVGYLNHQKRHTLVVQAIANLVHKGYSSLLSIIVGEGPDKLSILKLIKDCGVENNVILTGQIPPTKLGAFYRSCSFFVLPSVFEGFGMVYLEAMIEGKPIICTTSSGISEFVSNGKCGLVISPDDQEALEESIRTLVDHPELRHRMGQKAALLASNFSWVKNAQQQKTYYEETARVYAG